ncbi:MAG: tryptophan synthase subunit beta [SAR324 cluster bacterium]|nr:tryptophan synthase subunit beta [SAR324 cluster bacterium]
MKLKYDSYYGSFGGRFNPEILHGVFTELTETFEKVKADNNFWLEYEKILKNYSGRPTPITEATNLTAHFKGAKILIKREDLNHTGSHKIDNVVGQGLLAQRMGKKRLIAETGAGQHGVAVATIAAKLGFSCTIYMGEIDAKRQRPNVFWMEKLGAEVIEIKSGSRTLKEAINEAFRDWVNNPKDTHYLLGTACGPHPFPSLVAWLQSIIGKEAKRQMIKDYQKLPTKIIASVGGGSNSLGIFQEFIEHKEVGLVAVEAAGLGVDTDNHSMRLTANKGTVGIAQGYKTLFFQDEEGQMRKTHSIAAGLDYIGVSPILAYLVEKKRIDCAAISDKEALIAAKLTMRKEGIIPALESAHALAQAFKEAPKMDKKDIILVNLSGRGDKDIFNFGDLFFDKKWQTFIKQKAANQIESKI